MATQSLAELWRDLSDEERESVLDTWDDDTLADLQRELDAEAAEVQAGEDPLSHMTAELWLRFMFPAIFTKPFAAFHIDLMEWADKIEAGERPDELGFVGMWPRGFSKSTLVEAIVAMLGCRGRRRYTLYCGDIQARAEDHLNNIAMLLETEQVAHYYPQVGKRLVGKWGTVKGWRRMRIRCGTGFTVDAIGLDTAARGVKLEDMRPDLIVLDDIDQHADSPAETTKKIDIITLSLLPAGSTNVAVFGVQNMVHSKSIFSRLVSRSAGFLEGAIVSGPIPAVVDPEYGLDERGTPCLTAGTSTWPEVKGIDQLNEDIRLYGLRAFRKECQHEEVEHEGALWNQELIDAHRINRPQGLTRSPSADALAEGALGALGLDGAEGALGSLDRGRPVFTGAEGALCTFTHIVVAVDPAVTTNAKSDETGIVVVGKGDDGRAYVLEDLSGKRTPRGWAVVALDAYRRWAADWIVGETNQGGDLIEATIMSALVEVGGERPAFTTVSASRGKVSRAEPVVALYQSHLVYHAGVLSQLEGQMTTWRPPNGADGGSKWSPDRLDALVWGLWKLMIEYGTAEPYSSAGFLDEAASPLADLDSLLSAAWN